MRRPAPPSRVPMGRRIAMWSLLALVLLVFARDFRLVHAPPAHLVFAPGDTADVAVVLSGDPGYSRTRAAVELLKAGQVSHLIFTGAGVAGDSALVLARVAGDMGALPDQIWTETTATNTLDNIEASRRLWQVRGARPERVVVVTSASHAARAGLVAKWHMPEVQAFVHPVPESPGLGAALREAAALLGYRVLGYVPWW